MFAGELEILGVSNLIDYDNNSEQILFMGVMGCTSVHKIRNKPDINIAARNM